MKKDLLTKLDNGIGFVNILINLEEHPYTTGIDVKKSLEDIKSWIEEIKEVVQELPEDTENNE